MMSPHYGADIIERAKIANSDQPSPALCDYVVLDIPHAPDGTYDRAAYSFLKHRGNLSKYMLTVDLNNVVLVSPKDINTPLLTLTALEIRRTVQLYGFGFYGDVEWLNASSYSPNIVRNNARYLQFFYEGFTEVITALGVHESEVANFFAFRPFNLASRAPSYQGLLEGLNSIPSVELRFVILLTITSERALVVQPSSSWDWLCTVSANEPTIKDAVELIATIRQPAFTFIMAVSLRWDLFSGLKITRVATRKLNVILGTAHRVFRYEEECSSVFRRSSGRGGVLYAGDGGCAFAKVGISDLATFETRGTLEHKMTHAYQYLNQLTKGSHRMGWLAYNATGGLAPQECDGIEHRLKKMREIVDRH